MLSDGCYTVLFVVYFGTKAKGNSALNRKLT